MYCLHYAEGPQPDNLLSFMLHELVFLGYHSSFALYKYICTILQAKVAATVRMHADAVFTSVGAS